MPPLRWIIIVALIGVPGCWYGREPYSSVTGLRHRPCPEQPQGVEIELHFENDKPERKYINIGLIEAVGGSTTTDGELLDEIRRRARDVGATAVLAVRKQFKTREKGELNPLNPRDSYRENYGATVFTGMAVCFVPREAPLSPCAAEEAAASAHPFAVAGHDRLAECEWKAGRYLEMADHARTAIRDNPNYARGYLDLSRAQRALGNEEEARAAAAKARALGFQAQQRREGVHAE